MICILASLLILLILGLLACMLVFLFWLFDVIPFIFIDGKCSLLFL